MAINRNFTRLRRRPSVLRQVRWPDYRLSDFMDASVDAFILLDQDLSFVRTNFAFQKLFGLSDADVAGKNIAEVFASVRESRMYDDYRSVIESGIPLSLEDVVPGSGFGPIHLSVKAFKVGSGLGIIATDITERKAAEQARRESEEHYSALVANLTDAVVKFKAGRVTWCNDRVDEVYGYTKDEIIGSEASFFYPTQVSPAEFARMISASMRQHGCFRGTSKFQKKDGTTADIEYSLSLIPGPEPTEVVAVAREITERKQMEEELRKSEEKLSRYLESSPDAIFITDSAGRFLYGNRVAVELTGHEKKDSLGRSFLDLNLLLPDYAAKAARVLELNLAGRPTGPDEFELVARDGRRVFVEISTYPMGKGDETEVIGIAREITERKLAEEEKRRLEGQLQVAGRLAAVGELAAGVAHELNNPLAAIQAFAQFLAAKRDLDDDTKRDVETIYREAQRATKITANLLCFARRNSPEKSLISINEALCRTIDLFAYRTRVNNIEMSTDLDPNLPLTMADFQQMQQVFVNIISNAEQAMAEAHGKGKLVAKTRKAGQMIRVTFTDSGPGISDDNLKRVFDPFFTTKEVGKGTGLGLSICYGLIQGHGGTMYARSKQGKGATFVVEIPIVPEDGSTVEHGDPIHVQGV